MFNYDWSFPEIYAYANLWPLKITENGAERYATTAELAAYTVRYKQMCDEYIARASKIYGPDDRISRLKGYTINRSDEPDPLPRVEEYRNKRGTSNADFKERSRKGEIIMSNYERSYVKITRKPELVFDTGSRTTVAIQFNHVGFATDLGSRGVSIFPNTRCPALMGSSAAFGHWRQRGNATWRFPPLVDPSTLLSEIEASKPDATHLVTETTSEANRRSLDVLTSMAEMPETLKSVLSGFRSIAKIVKDFKKGEVALSDSFLKRREFLDRKRKAELAKIDARRKGASKYGRILLERQRKRVIDTHSRAVKGLADELASSMADLWLNFRYNIMPNVYLVEDIEKTFAQWGREWTTTRNREKVSTIIPLFGQELSIDWTIRCLIKRVFEPNSLGTNAVSSVDVFRTAWELVTLSFVIDWFLNIGDTIASFTTPSSWKEEGCSLSWKCELDQEINFSNDPDRYGVITIQVLVYDRITINPLDYVGLVWRPDLSPVRQLDALALLWRPVRLLLSKIK